MATKQTASELKDLDVDRVDGVDKPATGRNFLLFKGTDGEQVMKSFGALATVAAEVLKRIRKDANAQMSRKSAIAMNGLAQVLGAEPVFVGKSVPTQPYEFAEPDADKRGPADEDLGDNFTARSMPGSMVGSVQFRLKEADELTTKGHGKPWLDGKDEDEGDEDEVPEKKTKKGAGDKDDDQMDASEKANRGVMRSVEALVKTVEGIAGVVAKQAEVIDKALGVKKVEKRGADDEDQDGERVRPRSRQVDAEDEPVRVRKSAGGYEPRFGVSFSDIAFGRQR